MSLDKWIVIVKICTDSLTQTYLTNPPQPAVDCHNEATVFNSKKEMEKYLEKWSDPHPLHSGVRISVPGEIQQVYKAKVADWEFVIDKKTVTSETKVTDSKIRKIRVEE